MEAAVTLAPGERVFGEECRFTKGALPDWTLGFTVCGWFTFLYQERSCMSMCQSEDQEMRGKVVPLGRTGRLEFWAFSLRGSSENNVAKSGIDDGLDVIWLPYLRFHPGPSGVHGAR